MSWVGIVSSCLDGNSMISFIVRRHGFLAWQWHGWSIRRGVGLLNLEVSHFYAFPKYRFAGFQYPITYTWSSFSAYCFLWCFSNPFSLKESAILSQSVYHFEHPFSHYLPFSGEVSRLLVHLWHELEGMHELSTAVLDWAWDAEMTLVQDAPSNNICGGNHVRAAICTVENWRIQTGRNSSPKVLIHLQLVKRYQCYCWCSSDNVVDDNY